MPRFRWLLRSKRNFIITAALHWTLPMTVVFSAVFFADGILVWESFLGILVITVLGGLAYGFLLCAYWTEKYGIFRDRE
jgi:prepilin signal peptidase PulO-like enzyme (type II secretory pathway)